MDTKWGEWQQPDNTPHDIYWSPYLHWSTDGSGGLRFTSNDGSETFDEEFFINPRPIFDWELFSSDDKGIPVNTTNMVIPEYAANKEYDPITVNDTELVTTITNRADSTETPLHRVTIIAGVIDVGIPLGHNRWRFENGKTRILSAWQMMAPWALKNQSHLPFGAEFSQCEINGLLKKHSGGQQDGWLNEHDFNVDTGVVNFQQSQGQRGASGHASHGAHILDIVAGMDPSNDQDFQERVRIIAINAPTSAAFKSGGTHLDAYMFYAIQRIIDIADKLWEKNNPDFSDDPTVDTTVEKGYPIVISMAFGKQAGSKDALDEFPAKLARIVQERKEAGQSKVRFVMPSGNDNLNRCNAFLEPKTGANEKLNWRILPQDHSANYVEVWGNDAEQIPISVSLTSPHSDTQILGLPGDVYEHQYRDLYHDGIVVARIYLSRITLPPDYNETRDEKDNIPHRKFRYVLCTAPTYADDLTKPTAPSGLWEITVKNHSGARVQCVLSVQTDQSLSPSDGENLRSYFDDKNYELFDDNGTLLESHSFPPKSGNSVENLDIRAKSPVRRHGTMNASAAHETVARVGGYRVSDRRPAPYSATGRGRPGTLDKPGGKDDGTILGSKLTNGRKGAPTASFPTDDGPAHFGILAAGAANGSVVAMRGTSFASAQGAREIINQLLLADNSASANHMLFLKAKEDEKDSKHPVKYSKEQTEVIGGGRIRRPDKQKAARF